MKIELIIKDIDSSFKTNCLINSRKREYVQARHALSYYLYHKKRMTQMSIGKIINKDHSSIIHSIRQHKDLYRFCNEYKECYNKFISLQEETYKSRRWLCVEQPFKIQRHEKV